MLNLLSQLRWYWRLRKLPTEQDLNNREVFYAHIGYQLAMAKHRDYLLVKFRPY